MLTYDRGAFLVLVCVLSLTPVAHAATPDQASDRRQAENLTQSLVSLGARYQNASAAGRRQILEDMLSAAQQRQELLASMIEDDPGEVLAVTVPASTRDGMPPEVQELVERQTQVEGELQVFY